MAGGREGLTAQAVEYFIAVMKRRWPFLAS